jgi:hypothetical protein
MGRLMQSLTELVRLIRFAQSSLSVALYEAAIERNRRGLEKALQARQDALVDLVVHRFPPRNPDPPTFLLKRKP